MPRLGCIWFMVFKLQLINQKSDSFCLRLLYTLQSLQGHSFGSHIFMAELKTPKNSVGINSHISGRREPNNFVPQYTPAIVLVRKSG